MTGPRIKIMRFSRLFEAAMRRFFSQYGESFARRNGKYVFAGGDSGRMISKFAVDEIESAVSEYVNEFSISSPEYCFIVGSCMPYDNIVFEYRTELDFPRNLVNFVLKNENIRYMLSEHDIDVDAESMNSAADSVFLDVFSNGIRCRRNAVAIRHSELGETDMIKILTYVFGRSNCVNIEYGAEGCIVDINDLISKCVLDKSILNKSRRFVKIVEEVKTYAEEKLKEIF